MRSRNRSGANTPRIITSSSERPVSSRFVPSIVRQGAKRSSPAVSEPILASSSGAGGTREIKEMLAFCAAHKIVAEVEVIGKSEVNRALDRLRRNDVRFRFVIDLSRD